MKVKISRLLDSYKHLYRFMPVPVMYQAAALDYFICYVGRFIAIEAKREGEDLTPAQRFCRKRIEAAGGLVFRVSNDEDLFQLKTVLDHLH